MHVCIHSSVLAYVQGAYMLKSDFCRKFTHALEQTPYTPYQREIIVSRYVEAVDDITRGYRWSAIMFFVLTNIITVGGLVATALTSLLQWTTIGDSARSALTWGVWGLTLTISVANIWMQAFSIYKKYVLGTSQRDKLMNEGWSFLAGCGRYTDISQDKRFGVFCDKIENIITDTTVKLLQTMADAQAQMQAQQAQQQAQAPEQDQSAEKHLGSDQQLLESSQLLDEVVYIGPRRP
jgi:sarcosine oxidase delta subunit